MRASQVHHSVQDIDGDGDFSVLSSRGMGAQGVANDRLVSTDLRLNQGAAVVLSRRLPSRPPFGRDVLDVAVALCRRCPGGFARHGIGARRHYDFGIGMAPADGVVNIGAVIGAVTGEGGQGALRLIQ